MLRIASGRRREEHEGLKSREKRSTPDDPDDTKANCEWKNFMNRRLVVVLHAVCVATASVALAQSGFPAHTGYVNDFARVLDASSREELETLLRATEQKTSAEVAVATVTSLNGMSVEEYANRLFQQWGIGKKREDNGILVLVAPSERQMRIEVGYGLEPILPDGLAGQIIREEFLPRFRDGDFAGGIQNGLRRIVLLVEAHHVLTPEERERLQNSNDGAPPLLIMLPFLGLFVALGSFALGIGVRTRTFFPLIWGGGFAGIPFVIALASIFTATLVVLLPVAIAMAVWGYRVGARLPWMTSLRGPRTLDQGWVMGTSSSGRSGSSSGSSWSSGSSGGSFGGGSSGGGGASGRW
jgi:uncharacterized protein